MRRQGSQHGHHVRTAKREDPRAEPVEHDAEAEQVRAGVEFLAGRLLGRHVTGRADDLAAPGQGGIFTFGAGQTEVKDLDASFARGIEPQIRRLDVTMDQAALMGRLKTFRDLAADAQDLRNGQDALLLQPIFEAHAFEKRHGDVGNATIFTDLVDGDDMVVIEFGRRSGFAQEALPGVPLFGDLREHDLERDRALELRILRLKDHPHPALAENLEDAISPQPPDLVRLLCRRKERRGLGGTGRFLGRNVGHSKQPAGECLPTLASRGCRTIAFSVPTIGFAFAS